MNSRASKKIAKVLKENSSLIFSSLAGLGVILTGYLAVKGTKKAMKNCPEGNFRETVSYYIPAAIAGLSTIALIILAAVKSEKKQESMALKYAALSSLAAGGSIEAYDRVQDEIAVSKFAESDVNPCECKDGEELFYDEYSHRYFFSNPLNVLEAEMEFNRAYIKNGMVSVNDFYRFLNVEGLTPIDIGDVEGWNSYSDYCMQNDITFIDIRNRKVSNEETYPYTSIRFLWPPEFNYQEAEE